MNTTTPSASLVEQHPSRPLAQFSFPRPAALAIVLLATLVALAVATVVVLQVLAVMPYHVLSIPVVVAGGVLLVATPTLVWEVGVAVVDERTAEGV